MTVLIGIIALVFLALFVLIPLLEKYGKQRSPEEVHKIARWITPLMVILIVLSAGRFFFAG